jgi:hypothetical protein
MQYMLYVVMLVAVGCAIILLLQQADLLPKPTQRLAAITLLHDLYRGELMAVNPFATVFIHLLVRFFLFSGFNGNQFV